MANHFLEATEMLTNTTTAMYTNTTSAMYTNTTPIHTTPIPGSDIPQFWGFIAAGISILFFGTNFVPVKKFDTGDGMFFQWILCISIWCAGLIVNIVRDSPKFYPVVMLGGFFWETGNICVVPIIKTIGLGLGLCIWGMSNLLSGWATGRFGLFGLNPDPPHNLVLNDIGVILAVCSAFIFAMVKNEVSTAGVDTTVTIDVSEESPLLQNPAENHNGPAYTTTHTADHDIIVFDHTQNAYSQNAPVEEKEKKEEEDGSFIDNMSPAAKRIFGIVLSLISGVFYGQMFTPAIYVQDNYKDNPSQNALDYVFSTFCGILASSTVYFLIYAAVQKNRPKVYPRAILPGFVSGAMWGVGTTSWFVANKVLSEAVAFPIITTGPGIVASLLGVLVFKEIQGWRNIRILLLGMTVTITGSVLAGLSKA